MNDLVLSRELALPLGSLDSYIAWANKIPMLSHEEELELASKLHVEHNVEAARRLVLAHLRFVVRIARGYAGYGLPQGDLIQEGNIGLMKAVKRFDPNVGVRLVTFAVHWIKAEIHEYIIKNWRIVKIATTKAQRKVFFNMRRLKKRLGWSSQEEIQMVANELGVKPEVVSEMETRLDAHDVAFDLNSSEDDEHSFAPVHYLEDKRYNPSDFYETHHDQEHGHQQLMMVFKKLDPRSQDILARRFLTEGEKATLHDLAAQYKVSAERIRQIEQNALKKLREALEAAA